MIKNHLLAALVGIGLCTGAAAEVAGLEEIPGGRAAPAIALDGVDGSFHRLIDYRGQVILVNFWASWCPPCVREIPSMQRLADMLQGRPFQILAVNVGEGRGIARRYSRYMGKGFTVLLDKDSAAFKTWQGKVLPSSYLLDGKGRLRFRVQGPLEWDSPAVVDTIDQLIPNE